MDKMPFTLVRFLLLNISIFLSISWTLHFFWYYLWKMGFFPGSANL